MWVTAEIYLLVATIATKVSCDCGLIVPQANPSDANQDGSGTGIFPWLLLIYHERIDHSLQRVCFGNLISPDVLITAAGCFRQTPVDLHNFYVVTSNYTPFDIPSDMTIQKTRVDTLHRGNGYDEWRGRPGGNLAWLVLEQPLSVTPACIDLEDQQDTEQLPAGLVGQTIPFRTIVNGVASTEIRRIEVTDKSYSDCYNIFPEVGTQNISCAELSIGSSSIFQYTGSGFYLQRNGRWYLRAIISDVNSFYDVAGPHNTALIMNVQRFAEQINRSGAIKSTVFLSDFLNQSLCLIMFIGLFVLTLGCGIAAPPVNSLIINGFRAELGRFPWHVGVYRKNSNGSYSQICAGSLISTKVVISAAHCFYDEVRRRKLAANKFAIAAGKFYRSYDAQEIFVQKSAVLTIHLSRTYYGVAGNYAEDIAWLILQHPFYYSAVVSPVCIDEDNLRQDEDLRAGRVGKVVGWGRTETGVLSNELREANLPFIPYETCIATLPLEFIPFLTFDKFCAGYQNGTTLCDGDSGGGLAFYRGGTWYLRGIVSVSPLSGSTGTCPNFYTAFTNIGHHTTAHRRIINLSI